MAGKPEDIPGADGTPFAARAAFAAIVFLAAFAFLRIPDQPMVTGDSVPYRYLPEAIMKHGTLHLDQWPELAGPEHYAIVTSQDGHLVSKKPVLPSFFILPVYIYWNAAGEWEGDAPLRAGRVAMSAVASLAAALLALALLPLTGWTIAGLAGAGLVMATPFWFTAMDAWPHPLTALANVMTLLVFAAMRGQRKWIFIGAAQGLAFACRPGSVAVALVCLLFALLGRPGGGRNAATRAGLFIAGMAPFLILVGLHNHVYFGGPFSTGFGGQAVDRIRWPFEGVAGMLASPAKGLLLFAPLLSCAALMPAREWKRPVWLLCAFGLLIHLLFWSAYADWWGGWAWGPRYMADAMPFAVAIAAGGLAGRLRLPGKPGRVYTASCAGILLAVSIAIQVTGITRWDGSYHQEYDQGWGEGRHWVWTAPWEPAWRLAGEPGE